MTYDEIAKRLHERGHTWASAARVLNRGRTTLVRTAKRDMESRPAARALSALLMAPEDERISEAKVNAWVAEVFPDVPSYAKEPAASKRERLMSRDQERLSAAGLV